MRNNLAVFLDENVPKGGELQIKRHARRGGFGSEWDLTLWVPLAGSDYPRAALRLRANTAHALMAELDAWLEHEEKKTLVPSSQIFAPAPVPT